MELYEPEIKILSQYVRGMTRILNIEKEYTFTDIQIILSNTADLLPYSTTATIINILKSHGALVEKIVNSRKRVFLVNKEKMREIINIITAQMNVSTKVVKQ
jgi:hypothetical protein